MHLPAYALTDSELLAACEETALRASGPGGQHVNKTDSAVRLRHRETGICSLSREHRERARNRSAALRHLRLQLAVALRGVSDPQWLEPYRRGRQLAAGAKAQDYPLLAAAALDALQQALGSPAAAAQREQALCAALLAALREAGVGGEALAELEGEHAALELLGRSAGDGGWAGLGCFPPCPCHHRQLALHLYHRLYRHPLLLY
jgi:hypothetical protein